jgi:hypothetical protein
VECRLVTDKTQVTAVVKITILRMELVLAVNSVRLARRAFLRMLRTQSRKFNEFVGTQVKEVKVNSDMEN